MLIMHVCMCMYYMYESFNAHCLALQYIVHVHVQVYMYLHVQLYMYYAQVHVLSVFCRNVLHLHVCAAYMYMFMYMYWQGQPTHMQCVLACTHIYMYIVYIWSP